MQQSEDLLLSATFDHDSFRAPALGSPAWRRALRAAASTGLARHLADPRQHLWLKRWFDVTVASIGLLGLALPLLAITAAIRVSSRGPALFRQARVGFNGRRFEILKFRTMYIGEMDPSGVRQTKRDDPRVTPLGRFLRRANIDELPQLINVLRGEMSLVGPRPHVPGMLAGGVLYEVLVPYYSERHRMPPGLTGLAQMNALRGCTEDPAAAKARIDCDLAYIDNWSLGLDLYILLNTLRTELLRCSGV